MFKCQIGRVEWWKSGVMECWSIGVLGRMEKNWNVGRIELMN
jgi:hypothetical protein